MRRGVLAAATLGLAVALAPAPPAPAQISILGLKNRLVQFALEQISVPGSFEITAEGVAEPENGVTELQGVAIADGQGVWFRAASISLNWSPSRILAGELVVNRLAARDVELLRLPPPAEDAAEEETKEQAAAFEWPRAPITTRIGELRMDDVRIAEGVIAPQALAFDAEGEARDAGDVQAVALRVTRTDAVEGRIKLAYARDFAADTLQLDLDAEEGPGGVVAELAGLPPEAGARLNVQAYGPLGDWGVFFDLEADGVLTAEGDATLDAVAPVSAEALVTVRPGQALSPEVRAALGEEARLDVLVRETEGGVVRIERGEIVATDLSVRATGDYARESGALDFDVSAEAREGLSALVEGAAFETVAFDGDVNGTVEAFRAQGAARLAGLRADAADVAEARLDLVADVEMREGEAGPRVQVELDGDADGVRLDKLRPETVGRARLSARAAYEDAVARLDALTFRSPLLEADASGEVRLEEGSVEASYAVTAPDLAPVAQAYGQDADGRLSVQGRAEGPFSALRIAGEARLAELTFDGGAYGDAALTHDVTLGETIEGTVALEAPDTPIGAARARTAFRLEDETLEVSELSASALETEIAGRATVRLDETLADGALTVAANDLGAYEALAPFVPALEGSELAGTLRGEVRLDSEGGRQNASADLTGQGISGLGGRLDMLELTASGRDLTGSPSGSTEARIDALDLGELGENARIASLDLTAELEDFEGAGAATARLTARDVDFGGFSAGGGLRELTLDAKGEALGTAPRGTVEAQATGLALGAAAGDARIAGLRLEAQGEDLAAAPKATARLTASEVDFGAFAPGGGAASVVVDAQGSDLIDAPTVEARVAADKVGFGELAPGVGIERLVLDARGEDLTGAASAQAELVAESVSLGELAPGEGIRRVSLTASGENLIDAPEGVAKLVVEDADAAGARLPSATLDASLEQTDAGARLAAALDAPNVEAEGVSIRGAALKATVDDALGAPVLDATLGAERVRAGEVALSRLQAGANGPLEALDLSLTARGRAGEDMPVSADVAARMNLAGQGPEGTVSRLRAVYGDAVAELRRPLAIVSENGGTALRNIDLALPGGALKGEAAVWPDGLSGRLALDAPRLPEAAALADVELERGALNARAEFDTRPASARARIDLRAEDVALKGAPSAARALALDLDANWDGARMDAEASLGGDFGEPLRLTAAIPLRPAGMLPAPPPGAPIQARIRWSGDIGPLWAYVPAPDHVLSGRLDIDMGVTGTIEEPHPKGEIRLTEGQYQNLVAGTILTRIEAATRIKSGADFALEATASDGSGARISADVALAGDQLDASLTAKDAILVRRDDVAAAISADIAATGPVIAPAIVGEVIVERAEVRLVNAIPPSVADLGPVEIKGAPPAKDENGEEGDGPTLDIAIRAPDDIFVRGRGLDSEWMIDLAVRGPAADPAITGRIEKRRGTLDFVGKRFDLATGEIAFSGARPPDPTIDVALQLENNGILGTIAVTGYAADPEIEFRSRPSLPEDEVLPRLLFGRSKQSLTSSQAIQLAAGIATLMSGQEGVLGGVRSATGLDVLSVDQEGDETSVRVGKNVAEGVYVGAKQPLDGSGAAVEVEVEIFDDFTITSETSDRRGTSLGVKWRRDF